MNAFEKLKATINAAETDAIKFYGRGNKTAGVRLRKALQQVKRLAHTGRKEVISQKSAK